MMERHTGTETARWTDTQALRQKDRHTETLRQKHRHT